MDALPPSTSRRRGRQAGITAVWTHGYKSLADAGPIEIGLVTILAGANSSGKSSALQPLLLLKQTLEATFDPGPLLLNGPNVQFTDTEQLLTRVPGRRPSQEFSIGVEVDGKVSYEATFRRRPKAGLEVTKGVVVDHGRPTTIVPTLTPADIQRLLPADMFRLGLSIQERAGEPVSWKVVRNRAFLRLAASTSFGTLEFAWPPIDAFTRHIPAVIHVPALRGNPSRTYRTTSTGPGFPGTFEQYVASVIYGWQEAKDERIRALGASLSELGLTWKIAARRLDDTQVELRVGRLTKSARGGARDLVSLADVGFGISQSLPVVVALLTATKDELVYIEQPEIHLHPRAHGAMAKLIATAARRGVRVVVETHSDLLLLGIQTLVASGDLSASAVRLYWFQRDAAGLTNIVRAVLDRRGGFGPWPEDFTDVAARLEDAYLTAASRSRRG